MLMMTLSSFSNRNIRDVTHRSRGALPPPPPSSRGAHPPLLSPAPSACFFLWRLYRPRRRELLLRRPYATRVSSPYTARASFFSLGRHRMKMISRLALSHCDVFLETIYVEHFVYILRREIVMFFLYKIYAVLFRFE